MKRSRISYDGWKCILKRSQKIKKVDNELLCGHVGLMDMLEVTEPQTWQFKGREIVVCDTGYQWLTILPQNDFYCITAMINREKEIVVWYIDMICSQGIDPDGVPWYDDLYLDLVVAPNGEIVVDDMDELEEALREKDISEEQFQLALETGRKLQEGMLANIDSFKEYTYRCVKLAAECSEQK